MTLLDQIKARVTELNAQLKQIEVSGTRKEYNQVKAKRDELMNFIPDEKDQSGFEGKTDAELAEEGRTIGTDELQAEQKPGVADPIQSEKMDEVQSQDRTQREQKQVDVTTMGEEE